MISYKDDRGEIHVCKYYKTTINIDLSHKNIVEIIRVIGLENVQWLNLGSNKLTEINNLDELTNLQTLHLHTNQITEIKGLDKLINLTTLNMHSNQIVDIKGLDKLINLRTLNLGSNKINKIKGLEMLVDLGIIYLYSNQITEIKGLEELVNLIELSLEANKITEIRGLEKLVNLRKIDLGLNQITDINGFDNLINLNELDLHSNQIIEIKGLNKLNNLQELHLGTNEITEIKGINELTNLEQFYLHDTKIKAIPLKIMNLRRLYNLSADCEIDPIVVRFLDRNRVNSEKTIFEDSQNVHDSHIVKSIQDSIYKIISNSVKISLDQTLKEIMDDKILDKITKEQLLEYCQDNTIHSVLNLTFDEVLCYVWNVITEHKENEELKYILNTEMKDSMCKCFTGRLSRLINCLNGFDSRVSIKISDKQDILNVIIKMRNTFDNVEIQKREVVKELLARGYEKVVIDEYLIYLE